MKILMKLQTRRLSALTAALLVALLAFGLLSFISISYADGNPDVPYTLDTGYLGFAYGTDVDSDHTASRPESKVWWNDGFWWGSMWNDELDEFHIYRLNWGSQAWEDTGVALDDRLESRADVLWDEANNKLYVASRFQKDNPSTVNDPVNWARLFRFTYDEASESYILDSGFPTTGINEDKTNSLVIDKDSAGQLWASYVSRPQGSNDYQVYVNASNSASLADDDNWQTPFSLFSLFPDARVAVDDISSIVAFDDTVGVMWTNQLSGTLNFALHDAAEPLTSGWTHTTVPISGTIDDHLSLKANSGGQLFAAIKTSAEISDTGETLVAMVTRNTGGQFSFHEYSKAEENDTRPILVIDEDNDQVYVFVTGKPGGSMICYKTAAITSPLSNMAFAPGDCGTEFMLDGTYDRIDSATASKHSINNTTGLAVLASDDHNGNVYVHNVIGDPPPVVTSRSPEPGEPNVAVDAVVMATFSHDMDLTTVTGSTFRLEDSGGAVGGNVAYDDTNRTATFTPTTMLKASTVYTANVTTGMEDTDGTPLYEAETWNFTTVSPTVSFEATNYSVNEAAGTATITVKLNTASSISTTVDYTTSDGTATAGSDYATSSGTVTFDAGETSKTFTVPITDDGDDEPNETVNLALSNPLNASLGTPDTAELTIIDDDGDPTVQFQPAAINVDEGAGSATITVTLSHASVDTVTVDYATSDSTATAGSDYTAQSDTLTFAPDDTVKTFSVPITDDTLDEPSEIVNLALSNPSNATLGMPDHTAELTIADNDPPVRVRFDTDSYTVDEDAGTATIAVQLSAASGFDVTVDYATSAGSATGGSDYLVTSGSVTFSAGEVSKTFTVPIVDDALNEPSETVQLALSNPSNATLGTPSNATLTIEDDDPVPTAQFSIAGYTVNESAGTATITVTLSAASGQTTAVDYATSDGTATAGSDYSTTSGTLDFAVGETSKTFTVSILDDSLGEGDETINLTLSNPDDAALGTPSSATLTITDDDDHTIYMPAIFKPSP